MPHGEFIEVHAPLDEYHRYKLVSFEPESVLPAQENSKGKVTGPEKLRGRISQFLFEDRVTPVTPAELEAAHHEHAHDVGELESAHRGHH